MLARIFNAFCCLGLMAPGVTKHEFKIADWVQVGALIDLILLVRIVRFDPVRSEVHPSSLWICPRLPALLPGRHPHPCR